ncbi:MAG: hypothetical protein GF418_13900, partial [Chitinivibrionales bacterium]|nr:hypothetical protein [Chitinivibrionales bacterium]MBD3396715.1 hypothetical protein [Chitinivibrionales bacterium]
MPHLRRSIALYCGVWVCAACSMPPAAASAPSPAGPNASPAGQSSSSALVRITSGSVRVLEEISPDSPVLGLAYRDAYFPVVAQTESWCQIEYKGKRGWVEKRHLDFVEKRTSPFLQQLAWVIVILAAAGGVLVVIRILVMRQGALHKAWIRTVPT